MENRRKTTQQLVLGAILTAIVVLLQFMGSSIKLGPFSISLVLIPIVIGAATCGAKIGAWLGLIFGIVVLISGDAAAFLSINTAGTVVTVILKGALCGYFSGLAYRAVARKNSLAAVLLSAIVCAVTNTGIFLLGCLLFFMDTIEAWAAAANLGGGVAHYMIFGLVGANFLFELLVNIVLSPVIVRLLKIKRG